MEDRSPLDPSEYDPKLSEERLARLVRLAARAFNRSLQLRLHTEGVSFGQWIFLRILWYDDGLSQRELSQRAHLTEPTAHSALTKLEKQGLIIRRNMEGNKRRLHTFLTPKGWELRDKLEPLAVEVNSQALRDIPYREERILRKALLQIIDNLEQDEEDAARRGLRVPPTRDNS